MPRFPKIFPHHPGFAHGGDYNPDQWLDRYPGILDEDLRRMDEAGCDTFSVGIFSWARYEPRNGEYHFDWMHSLLDRLHAAGKTAVLATPSGSKPAWLSHESPEVCRVDAKGRRDHHHARHNHCFTSPVYRQKVAEMNRRLAENFGAHPAVKMWHISNEYSGECYCDLCLEAFRSWLKARYGSLEELNHAWWSHFWSHTITDWHLIDPRDNSVDGMRLDWLRFVTAQTVDFMKAEVHALREGGATQPVTTNMMGTFPHIDYWRFVEEVDVIADDCYPAWKFNHDDIQTAAATAMIHDMHRSMKGGRPWMLMESCTCSTQWIPVPKRKRPGVYETEMLQAVAHGADTVMYFQWRKGRGGMEKYHGAVVDHEGTTHTREFRQVCGLSARLRALQDITGCGLTPHAAILHDWEVRWAMETSDGIKRYQDEHVYLAPVQAFHRAFWQAGVPVDVVESTVDFSTYRLIIAPQLYLLKPGVGEALMQYVENGGTLVLTARSGMVNDSNLCFTGGFPGGGLRQFCGIWAEEVDTLYPGESQTVQTDPPNPLGLAETYTTGRIVEYLHAEKADVLATLTTDYYAGAPVLTRRTQGRGTVYYLGAWMEEAFHHDFIRSLCKQSGLRRVIETDLPPGVTAQMRTDDANDFIFVQNFTTGPKTVQLDKQTYQCMESGETLSGSLELPPWSTRILRRPAVKMFYPDH